MSPSLPGPARHVETGRAPARRILTLLVALLAAQAVPFVLAVDQGDAPLAETNTNPISVCGVQNDLATYEDVTGKAVYADGEPFGDFWLGLDTNDIGFKQVWFGAPHPFNRVQFAVAQESVGGSVSWALENADSVPIDDKTDGFSESTGYVSFDPPDNWGTLQLHAECPGNYYYIRVETGTKFTLKPSGAQVSLAMWNLRVKAEDETGASLASLGASHWEVSGTADRTIYAYRSPPGLPAGTYELALQAQSHPTADLALLAPGMLPTTAVGTGELARSMRDLTGTPFVAKFPLKVIVRDRDANPVSGANVTLGGQAADATVGHQHFFKSRSAGALSVQRSGYDPIDTVVDTQAAQVHVGTGAQTIVVLSGSDPCDDGGQVAAGVSVTCRGLRRIPGASTGPASPPPSSSIPPSTSQAPASMGTQPPAAVPTGPNPFVWVTPTPKPTDATIASYEASLPVNAFEQSVIQLNFTTGSDPFLRKVQFTVRDWNAAARLDVKVVGDAAPPAPPLPAGSELIARVDLDLTSSLALTTRVLSTTMTFNVTKALLEQRGAGPEDVRVLRYSEQEAAEATPQMISEDAENYMFSVATPGSSDFVAYTDASHDGGAVWAGWWVLLGLVALLVGLGLVVRLSRRPKRRGPGGWEPLE